MLRKGLILTGHLVKPHGTGGKVIIRLTGQYSKDFIPGNFLFLEIDETLIPFCIEETEYLDDKVIVKLELIDDKKEAVKYAGSKVYLDTGKETDPQGDIWIYTGYIIRDLNTGMAGIITGIIDMPGNPLFEVRQGNKNYLIPAQPDLVVRIDEEEKYIVMKLPEGLLDI